MSEKSRISKRFCPKRSRRAPTRTPQGSWRFCNTPCCCYCCYAPCKACVAQAESDNQEKFHRSMPLPSNSPTRPISAVLPGASRRCRLSGSTTNQTRITTIAGAAFRGAQRRLLQRLALLEQLPTQMMTSTASVARPPQRLVPQSHRGYPLFNGARAALRSVQRACDRERSRPDARDDIVADRELLMSETRPRRVQGDAESSGNCIAFLQPRAFQRLAGAHHGERAAGCE